MVDVIGTLSVWIGRAVFRYGILIAKPNSKFGQAIGGEFMGRVVVALLSGCSLFAAPVLVPAWAADMPVKALPVAAVGYNWAGAYAGVNVGAVWDRNDLGLLTLTSPGFAVADPTGAFSGTPVGILIVPGAFAPVATANSGPGTAFVAGGQAGYNWQSGRVVYGVEGDLDATRSRQAINGTLSEFFPGVNAGGNITRTTTGNFTIERLWQASLRGRVGYTWDRLMVYATGGLAVTSIRTDASFTYATIIGGALTPLGFAPPQNFIAPGTGSKETYLGSTFGAGFEYALTGGWSIGGEYRYTDFGKRDILLAAQPPAGAILPATPIRTTLELSSHQLTGRMNYRFEGTKGPLAAVAAAPARNWNGCYAGGTAGAAWSRSTIDTFDPSTNTAVFGPPPFTQTPFYNTIASLSAAPAPFGYDLNASVTGGLTLGCNWQKPSSLLVWGVEGDAGFMRLRGTTTNPYNIANGFNDTTDATTVGNWYGVLSGRLGYAVDRTLLYVKGGAGFTHVESKATDTCTTGPTCSAQTLGATGSATPAFLVIGGGAEWAWTEQWSVKAEYLYLGIHEAFAVCGPGGGGLFAATFNFCADHTVDGIHTTKVGVNYKFR